MSLHRSNDGPQTALLNLQVILTSLLFAALLCILLLLCSLSYCGPLTLVPPIVLKNGVPMAWSYHGTMAIGGSASSPINGTLWINPVEKAVIRAVQTLDSIITGSFLLYGVIYPTTDAEASFYLQNGGSVGNVNCNTTFNERITCTSWQQSGDVWSNNCSLTRLWGPGAGTTGWFYTKSTVRSGRVVRQTSILSATGTEATQEMEMASIPYANAPEQDCL